MRDYTVMLVGDERSPVRRFHLPRRTTTRAMWGAGIFVLVLLVGFWDYWRLRADNAELDSLRVLAAEQRERIEVVSATLDRTQGQLRRVEDLERKVRIIANLPGAAATGGEDLSELAPDGLPGTPPADLMIPVGVPVTPQADVAVPVPNGQGGLPQPMDGLTTGGAEILEQMDERAERLGEHAAVRGDSLDDLLGKLEQKQTKLASLPSVWPARGWLTSRFGYRISPFTGKRQRHAGIDIAARRGTAVIAPARGRVKSVGRRGPLGRSLVVDHGYGVRTLYGHNDDIFVEVGDQVVRGQKIAAVGSTGRSTGPHLHYVVEVNGKPKDPLNYIFD